MLTGKCKNDFNNWYANKYSTNNKLEGIKIKHIHNLNSVKAFNVIPFSMQYGVYVDFFDSVGINCELFCDFQQLESLFSPFVETFTNEEFYSFEGDALPTRAEARRKVIEKANEIYNLNE